MKDAFEANGVDRLVHLTRHKMRVHHRHFDVRLTEEPLHGMDGNAALHKPGGADVALMPSSA